MLSTFNIVMIIIIILMLSLIGYIMIIDKKPSQIKSLLDNLTKVFNIKINEKTSENFDTNIVFNTLDDATKNMGELLKYAVPTIDMNEINKSLKDNGLDKTAESIFEEHKYMDSIQYLKVFNLAGLMRLNAYNSFTKPDNEIIDYIKLYFLTLSIITNLYITKNIQTYADVKTRLNGVEYIKTEFDEDFLKNDIINVYRRTSKNENVSIDNANEQCQTTEWTNDNTLCKQILDLNKFINEQKQIAKDNIDDINKLFKLLVVKYLFDLNNVKTDGTLVDTPINVPTNITNDIDNLKNKLETNNITIPDSFLD